jgi:hypothetical protein
MNPQALGNMCSDLREVWERTVRFYLDLQGFGGF